MTREEQSDDRFNGQTYFKTAVFAMTESGKVVLTMVKLSAVISFSDDFIFPFDEEDTFLPEKVVAGEIVSSEVANGYHHIDNRPFHSYERLNQAFQSWISIPRVYTLKEEKLQIPDNVIAFALNNETSYSEEENEIRDQEIYLLVRQYGKQIRRILVLAKAFPGVSLDHDINGTFVAISPEGNTMHMVTLDSPWPFTFDEQVIPEAGEFSAAFEDLRRQQQERVYYKTEFSFVPSFNFRLEQFVHARVVGSLSTRNIFRSCTSPDGAFEEYSALRDGYVFYNEGSEGNLIKRWLIIMRSRARDGRRFLETVVFAISPKGKTKIVFHENQYAPYVPEVLPYAYDVDDEEVEEWKSRELTVANAGEFDGYSYQNGVKFTKYSAIESLVEDTLRSFRSEGGYSFEHDFAPIAQSIKGEEYTPENYSYLVEAEAGINRLIYILQRMDGFTMRRWIVKKIKRNQLSAARVWFTVAAAVHTNGKIVIVCASESHEGEYPWPFISGEVIAPYSDVHDPTITEINNQLDQPIPNSGFSSSMVLNSAINTFYLSEIQRGGWANHFRLRTMSSSFIRESVYRDQSLLNGGVAMIKAENKQWIVGARFFREDDSMVAHFEFHVHAVHPSGHAHLISQRKDITWTWTASQQQWPFKDTRANEWAELKDDWVEKAIELEIGPEVLQGYDYAFDYPFHPMEQINLQIVKLIQAVRQGPPFYRSGQSDLKARLIEALVEDGEVNEKVAEYTNRLKNSGELILEYSSTNDFTSRRHLLSIEAIESPDKPFMVKQMQLFAISSSGKAVVVYRRRSFVFDRMDFYDWPFERNNQLQSDWSSSLIDWSVSPEYTNYTYIEVAGTTVPFSPVPEINSLLETILRTASACAAETSIVVKNLQPEFFEGVQTLLQTAPAERHEDIMLESGRILRGTVELYIPSFLDHVTSQNMMTGRRRYLKIVRRFDSADVLPDTRTIEFAINPKGIAVKTCDSLPGCRRFYYQWPFTATNAVAPELLPFSSEGYASFNYDFKACRVYPNAVFDARPLVNLIIMETIYYARMRNYYRIDDPRYLDVGRIGKWDETLRTNEITWQMTRNSFITVPNSNGIRHLVLMDLQPETTQFRKHFDIRIFGVTSSGNAALLLHKKSMVEEVWRPYPEALSAAGGLLPPNNQPNQVLIAPEVDKTIVMKTPALHSNEHIAAILHEKIMQPYILDDAGTASEEMTTGAIIQAFMKNKYCTSPEKDEKFDFEDPYKKPEWHCTTVGDCAMG